MTHTKRTVKRAPKRTVEVSLTPEQKTQIAEEARRLIGTPPIYSPVGSTGVPVAASPRGAALKSTVLLSDQAFIGGDLLAFSTAIGSPLPGGGSYDLICTAAETNMKVSNMLVDEPMTVREIWYDIPRVSPARFQRTLPCGHAEDYILRAEDVRQIITMTYLRFCVSGDRPWFQAKLDFAESSRSLPGDVVTRGVFKLPLPVEIGRIEKFWVELSWPTSRPVFGKPCERTSLAALIPLTIYLVP